MHSYPQLPNNALEEVNDYLKSLQKNICQAFETVDGKAKFILDHWRRASDGGGISGILTNGQVFERAGVNFSSVSGASLPPTATASRPELAGYKFQAMGVSVVAHPHNPYVPTAHANVRFFCAHKEDSNPIWWFGGGFDLTPFYGFKQDCIEWHQNAKDACAPFGEDLYARFKYWCDQYFYLKHRQEARGVGGLFFDDFYEKNFTHSFKFMQSVGNHFLTGYLPIINRRKNQVYSQREKDFQLYRRGRYVEFNLLYDRGTLFGLQSGGRTESILMSMPPMVAWEYNRQEEINSAEAALYRHFLPAKNWLND